MLFSPGAQVALFSSGHTKSQRVTHPQKRYRASEAVDLVLSDVDLIAYILTGTLGPSTFNAATLVCKAWHSVCRNDERVLRSASVYTGGLTKSALIRLFAISSKQADALPRTQHVRFGGGTYFLYREGAVDAILADGGMGRLRERFSARAANPWSSHVAFPVSPLLHGDRRCVADREERLHARLTLCKQR